jgi:hypothetical protein
VAANEMERGLIIFMNGLTLKNVKELRLQLSTKTSKSMRMFLAPQITNPSFAKSFASFSED